MVQFVLLKNKESCAHAGASSTTATAPMSLPAEPPPPPPSRRREHETLIQYNLRNKVCAYCKRPGARLKCEAVGREVIATGGARRKIGSRSTEGSA